MLKTSKGVTCKAVPPEEMPVDENGNRADVVIYGGSTIKRMNMGRMHEQFINAASRDLTHKLRMEAGLDPKNPPTKSELTNLSNNQPLIKKIFNTLLRYYKIVAPIQHELLDGDEDRWRHVSAVLEEGIYLYVPPDNPVNNLEMANELRNSEFCPHFGPVTYRNAAGQVVQTKTPVLIGSLYMIMLEKTGDGWSGVASVKTQHFGVPAKITNYDKHSTPGRQQPVRATGESETRSYVSTIGPEATMEMMDRSNNPDSHKRIVESLLRSPTPGDIDQNIDRGELPMGGSRPNNLVDHLFMCRGLKFTYIPETRGNEKGRT